MCALVEGSEVQIARYLEAKEKWTQAKEALRIRSGLQGIETKITFGELGVHRALWVKWINNGRLYFTQYNWEAGEESSNSIKYNWIWEAGREYYKEKAYIKAWMRINA